MNQMYLLLIGVLGIAAVGSLLSGGDDDEEFDQGTPVPDIPFIDGTNDPDNLEGTAGDDLIRGLRGNDTIDGGGGNDWIYAGEGNDEVAADPGNDRIFLGGGDDVYGDYDIGTDEGSDTIEGGSGDDTITVNSGTHEIWGDDADGDLEGDDSITAYGGQVTIHGGKGNDTLAAFDGTAGGEGVSDTLYGGDGNDVIHVGSGDFADGGDGRDIYHLSADMDESTIAYGQGDTVVINYEGSPDSPPEVKVVQAGDDAQVVVNGTLLATLKNTQADSVRTDLNATPRPAGGGYVPPVTDPEPVVVGPYL